MEITAAAAQATTYTTGKTLAEQINDYLAVSKTSIATLASEIPGYAFDASPAWEDITAQVAINRVYNFLNQSKTAEKWGVNVRFTIEKNEGYEGEVSISGFGGAYE